MSIYVAIEVLKFFQVRLIMSDKELVSETQSPSEKIYAKSLGVDAHARKKEKLQV